MLTAYDYSMASLIDEAGMDVILVGDSASNVMAGNVTTLPMTLDQMIYHGKSVVRGVKRALVVVDMPFGTYQGNSKEALASAIRVMKETHADCIKLEGGAEVQESIERILCAGIPIMGHLGLTPQSINKFGTYAVRAKDEAEAQKLIEDAHLLEKLGCFAIVLEKIPAALATRVAKELTITRHRYRSRRRCRRPSTGNARHAGYQPKFLTPFPASLCRPAQHYHLCGAKLYSRRKKLRLPQRKRTILIPFAYELCLCLYSQTQTQLYIQATILFPIMKGKNFTIKRPAETSTSTGLYYKYLLST